MTLHVFVNAGDETLVAKKLAVSSSPERPSRRRPRLVGGDGTSDRTKAIHRLTLLADWGQTAA